MNVILNLVKRGIDILRGTNNSISDSTLSYQKQIQNEYVEMLQILKDERQQQNYYIQTLTEHVTDLTNQVKDLNVKIEELKSQLHLSEKHNEILQRFSCSVLCKNRIKLEEQ